MTTKNIVLIAAGVVIIGGIAVAVTRTPTKSATNEMSMPSSSISAQAPKDANSIVISNYKFDPTPLKVKKGTTVTWTNTDIAKHNIVTDDGQAAGGPSGPLFGKGETYSFTFNTVGMFAYHCSPHPYMHGAIEVTE